MSVTINCLVKGVPPFTSCFYLCGTTLGTGLSLPMELISRHHSPNVVDRLEAILVLNALTATEESSGVKKGTWQIQVVEIFALIC